MVPVAMKLPFSRRIPEWCWPVRYLNVDGVVDVVAILVLALGDAAVNLRTAVSPTSFSSGSVITRIMPDAWRLMIRERVVGGWRT